METGPHLYSGMGYPSTPTYLCVHLTLYLWHNTREQLFLCDTLLYYYRSVVLALERTETIL